MESKKICKICDNEFIYNKHNNRGEICMSCRQLYYHYKLKEKALKYKGNKCSICGYDKCSNALEFHHTDPKEKDFSLHTNYSWETAKQELDKCIVVCGNCHRELHTDEYINHLNFIKKVETNKKRTN